MKANPSERWTLTRHAFTGLLRMALLAVAYLTAGKLALLLAIPPGFATAVWPAAGIALAACLAWGNGVWPGVFLGSLLTNLATGFDASSTVALLHALTLPAIIAAGAALQAVCGSLLVKRFVGFPLSLNRLPRISLLLLLGGPCSCLISATLGVTALELAGRIGPGLLVTNWLTWWLGDTLGVVVLLPLAAAWGIELQQSPFRTRLSVILPLALATTLTVGLFLHVRRTEEQNRQLVFSGQAENLVKAIASNIAVYSDVLFSIEGLFHSSQQVNRDEFRRFVDYSFARHQGIQALQWVPWLQAAERSAYEARARADGFLEFVFSERDLQGRLVPAAARLEYAPIYYLEPFAGNEAALGYDLASSTARREAIQLARDTGQPAATQRVSLIQGEGEHSGILLFVPIYATLKPPSSVSERQIQFKGVVGGVFQIQELVETAIRPLQHQGFFIEIYDHTAALNAELLYADSSAEATIGAPASGQGSTSLGYERELLVGGRLWRLRLSPTPTYLAGQQLWGAWTVMTGGLLFSSLLGSFLLLVIGRKVMTERVVKLRTVELQQSNLLLEQEVAERQRAEADLQRAQAELENRVKVRTAELRQSNLQLQQEIIEHRQSQEQLHASETRFRQLVQAAPDGIVIMDSAHRLVSVNDQAERLFGYQADELNGQLHRRLLPARFLQRHDQHQAFFLEHPSTRPMGSDLELYGLRKDGSEFPLEISLSPLPTPEGLQVICIVRDITLRKQTEQELLNHRTRLEELVAERTRELEEKSKALEKATRLKSEFLASMSHELRTPMNSIIGFSSILIKEMAGPLNFEQKKQLKMVMGSARHLLNLINDILDLSKIESGELSIDWKNISLVEVLAQVQESLSPQAEKKGVKLTVSIPPDVDRINTDSRRVRQILLNLVGNALKFTEQGEVRVLCHRLGDQLEVQVIDTGIGIREEDLQKLFHSFRQLDTGLARKYEGTGLGLFISQRLVQLLGGEIRVESQYGKGSSFSFTLPLTKESDHG